MKCICLICTQITNNYMLLLIQWKLHTLDIFSKLTFFFFLIFALILLYQHTKTINGLRCIQLSLFSLFPEHELLKKKIYFIKCITQAFNCLSTSILVNISYSIKSFINYYRKSVKKLMRYLMESDFGHTFVRLT